MSYRYRDPQASVRRENLVLRRMFSGWLVGSSRRDPFGWRGKGEINVELEPDAGGLTLPTDIQDTRGSLIWSKLAEEQTRITDFLDPAPSSTDEPL